MFKKLRYFDGQILSAGDFREEQAYHLEKRRLHNRLLHGAGIVRGLSVAMEPGVPDSVVVSAGFAIDPLGNEILVDSPVCLRIEHCSAATCFVELRYKEVPTDPVPSPGGVEFSRILESFSMDVVPPGPHDRGQALRLARLLHENGSWRVDHLYTPPGLHACR